MRATRGFVLAMGLALLLGTMSPAGAAARPQKCSGPPPTTQSGRAALTPGLNALKAAPEDHDQPQPVLVLSRENDARLGIVEGHDHDQGFADVWPPHEPAPLEGDRDDHVEGRAHLDRPDDVLDHGRDPVREREWDGDQRPVQEPSRHRGSCTTRPSSRRTASRRTGPASRRRARTRPSPTNTGGCRSSR